MVLVWSGCGESAKPQAALRRAVSGRLAGQWQGRSQRGELELSLAISPDGRYEWRQRRVGARKPELAHTGQWTPADAADLQAESLELLLSCETVHFDVHRLLNAGPYRLKYTRAEDGARCTLESPWGVFHMERVPEA